MFSDINILQGSVATPLRYGGICNDLFIANFLTSVNSKNFENRSIFGEVMDNSLVSCFYTRDAILARVFAKATCPSVCLSVRLPHAGIVPSRAKAGS